MKFFTSSSTTEENIEQKDHDYSQKSIDDFKLIFSNQPQNLTDQEKRTVETSSGSSYQDQSIKNNTKRIMTHILKSWSENKSGTRPSSHTMPPA